MALDDRNDTSNTIDTSDNRFGHLLDAVNKLKNNISSNENSWGYLLSAANQVDAVEEQVNKKICYDMITLGEEGINDYLLKDKNNFVIKLPGGSDSYECMSMDNLKKQWIMRGEDGSPFTPAYYKEWYECDENNNNPSPDNVIRNVSYVKIGTSNLLIEKPNWIYEGSPPEPRVFELVPNKEVKTITINYNVVGTTLHFHRPNEGEYCNTQSDMTYKLVNIGETLTRPTKKRRINNSANKSGGFKKRKTKKSKSKKNRHKKQQTKSKRLVSKKHQMKKVTKKQVSKKILQQKK